jgi:hypothetical protein
MLEVLGELLVTIGPIDILLPVPVGQTREVKLKDHEGAV